jgi:hypothetical protein
MRIFWAAAAASVIVCATAHAEGRAQLSDHSSAAVGVGIICNTSAQAEEFVKLRSSGAGAEQAMHVINASAHDEQACGIAAIAYLRDATVDTMKLKDKLVQIVRISVVAGFNGTGWQRVSGMVQYAVLEGGGQSI